MKNIFMLFLFFLSNQIFSQEFEGRIIYKNSCEKTNEINSFDLNKFLIFMGDTTEFTTKKGSYKKITNGSFKPYQLYKASQPIYFYKDKIQSDTLYFIDYRKYDDHQFEYKIEKKLDTILGYICDKLTITYTKDNSIMHYYFAPDLKQNPKYYKDYRHNNLNNVMKLTKSIILRYESLAGGMKITKEAIKVEKLKLNESEFKISKDQCLIDQSQ